MNNSFFILKRPNKLKIKYIKDKTKLNNSIFDEYQNIYKDYKIYLNTLSETKKKEITRLYYLYNNNSIVSTIVLKTYGFFDIKLVSEIANKNVVSKNKFKLSLYKYFTPNSSFKLCNNIKKCSIKSHRIKRNLLSKELYNKIISLSLCDIEIFLLKLKLTYILHFFDILEDNGSVFITYFNYCNMNILNTLYILTFMFEKVYIHDFNLVYCEGFLGEKSLITKNQILKIMKNNNFTISKDNSNFNELINYLNYQLNNKINLYKLLINNKINDFIKSNINNYIIHNYQYGGSSINKEQEKKLFKYIKKINIKKFNSIIKINEIKIINDIIEENKYNNFLQFRLKHGYFSILFLLNKHFKLTTLNEDTDNKNKNNGKKILKLLKLDKNHILINNNINNTIKKLINDKEIYDCIIINGFLKYDFIDTYWDILNQTIENKYINDDILIQNAIDSEKLLKVGGVLIITEAIRISMKKLIKYIDLTFISFVKINIPSESIVIYKKY